MPTADSAHLFAPLAADAVADPIARARSLTSVREAEELYRAWAESYDRDVFVEGGITGTTRIADLLAAWLDDRMAPILDLGCGWGSLSLRIAERFPAAQVVAISNSKPQGDFIRGRAASWPGGPLVNIEHRVVDVNALADADFGDRFDRIVTVEMLEKAQGQLPRD